MSRNPYARPGDITYGPLENCTLSTCDVRASIFQYQPSLSANAVFIALFGLSLIIHVAQGVVWKSWAFMIAMFLGCLCEMIGYGGRIIMHNNPFSFPGFITQIVCITIGPAFFSAAVYVTLSKIVIYLGAQYSRLKPSLYYYIFIFCDVVSLTLQATGGGMSSNSTGSNQAGVNIAIAGLSFQVFTLSVFILLILDFTIRYRRGRDRSERVPTSFKIFVAFLSLAILCIMIRCVYRIDELSDGYSGPLIHNEGLFIGLEGVMIIIAAFALNAAHPGPIFKTKHLSDVEYTDRKVVSEGN